MSFTFDDAAAPPHPPFNRSRVRVLPGVSHIHNKATPDIVDRAAEHPARRLVEAGVPITLNADDEMFFGASVVDEYELARRHLGFDDETLAAVAETSLASTGIRSVLTDADDTPPPGSPARRDDADLVTASPSEASGHDPLRNPQPIVTRSAGDTDRDRIAGWDRG